MAKLGPFNPWASAEGFSWRAQIAVFLAVAVVVVLRRPDALFNPQFYGEDGPVWFLDAYTLGWIHPLLFRSGGYLNTLPRLVADIAQLVPFRFAPLAMNLCGLAIQVLPANFLVSSRCIGWGSLPVRIVMAAIYVALPNSGEINVTITNAQFHLALIVCLLSFGTPPRGLISKIFDSAATTISGLTGPFCIALLPLTFVFWLRRRYRWTRVLVGLFAVCSAIQIGELLSAGTRTRAPLGATVPLFLRIIDAQVYSGALLGRNSFSWRHALPVLAAVAAGGTLLVAYVFARSTLERKLFVVFAAVLFIASLRHPLLDSQEPAWEILRADWGIRYWFFPMLAFIWSVVWCAADTRNPRWLRALALALALLSVRGISKDWKFPAYPNENFARSAAMYEAAAPGTLLTIPTVPIPWKLQFRKAAPGCMSLPMGAVDTPFADQHVPRRFVAEGWATGSEQIKRVRLYVGDQLVATGTLNRFRPDVDRVYRPGPNARQGWRLPVDLAPFAPGKYVMHVRINEGKACDAEVAEVPFVLPTTQ